MVHFMSPTMDRFVSACGLRITHPHPEPTTDRYEVTCPDCLRRMAWGEKAAWS